MALGDPIDEALDQLEPTAPVKQDPITAALDRMQGAGEVGLRRAVVDAQPVAPEQQAEARRLALKFGLPPTQALRQIDELKKREAVDLPFSSIETESPQTAEFLRGEGNAALAKDDMEQLGLLEWLTTAPSRAFAQSTAQMRAANLRTESLFRPLTREEEDELQTEKFYSELGGALGAGQSWFRKSITGGSQLLANVLMGFAYQGKSAAIGTATGAVIGGVGGSFAGGVGAGPGAVQGARFGFTVGSMIGGAEAGFRLEAGSAYDEYLDFKDEAGHTIDPDIAKAAALASGVINAGFETFQLERLAEAIPGVEKLKGVVGRSAIKQALRQPSIRSALKEAVVAYGANLTFETATEVAQRAVTILSGELAKYATSDEIALRTPSDVLQDLANEGAGALTGFALLGVSTPARTVARAAHEAKVGQANVAWFTALGEGTAASKLGQRSPEALEQFLAKTTDGGPVEAVYAPVDSWTTYWQSQGIDPAEMAKAVTGDPNAYADAQQSGTDLKIPTAKYATKLAATEHNAFFVNELKLDPEGMNGRQAAAFLEEQQKLAEEAAAAAGEPSQTEQVRAQLEQQLVERGGFDQRTARAYAGLVSSAVGTMAESAGQDPLAVYQRYGLTVERPAIGPEGTVAAPAATPEGEGGAGGGQGTPSTPAAPTAAQPAGATATPAVAQSGTEGTATGLEGLEDVPGLADLVAGLGGANVETVGLEGEQGTQENASGESAASQEALSRQSGMKSRGERFVVYNRSGQRRELIGPDAVDYSAKAGETYGVEGPEGFRQLENRGGRVPERVAGAATGPLVSDRASQLAHAHEERSPEGAGDGGGAEPRRLPSPLEIIEGVFERADPERDAERLTEPVRLELGRIAEEMNEFPFVPRSWSWEVADKSGNAAGGDANIVEGAAGAAVYDDVLQFSPLNKGKGGQAAKMVRGTRAQVEAAVRKILEGGTITSNLAEGAVRVAERRAAGDYRHIARPQLPLENGPIADEQFTDDLSEAIDAEVEAGALEGDAVDTGGDTSFDISEFGQGLFDLFEQAQQPEQTSAVPEGGEFPLAGENVDGRIVRAEVPNLTSIGASLTDYDVLPGVREIPMAAFGQEAPTFYSTQEEARTQALAEQIRQNKEIAPLVVVVDAEAATKGPYILEGGHRFDALQLLGATSFPAIVVVDNSKAEVDTLDTGEQQPRLPAAGAVRDQNIETPAFEAPFALTPTEDKGKRGKQRILFQGDVNDYGGEHRPPGPDDGAPASDLTGGGRIYPDDVYDPDGPRIYGTGDPKLDRQTFKILQGLKGKPDAKVKIYRAVPVGVDQQTINAGDWVTVNRKYAEDHGLRFAETGGEGEAFRIIEAEVSASEIFTNGDSIHEFGYWPSQDQRTLFQAQPAVPIPPAPLTQEDLEDWSDAIREREGLEVFDVRLENLFAGDLKLEAIAAAAGATNQGAGSRAMEALVDLADAHGKRIQLSLGEKGFQPTTGSAKTSSPSRLREFYKRFGFVDNKGRTKDFRLSIYTSMYRNPQGGRVLEQKRRGAIVIGPNRQIKIQLFERADLSTFLHESGHFFLEVFDDLTKTIGAIPAEQRTPEQQRMLADFAALQEFLVDEDHKGPGFSEQQHEQFARAFETYLGEGKAPSAELRDAFAMFRAWLIGIYRSLVNLRAPLTDEVRGVFDRMLASERAIVDATAEGRLEPMFLTAEQAGMSPQEFEAYANTVAAASRVAREQLDQQLAREVARERTAIYKARRVEVEAQVREQAEQAPVYRAQFAIRKGTDPKGVAIPNLAGNPTGPRKMAREVIEARYGKARADALSAYVKRGGVDPDLVADEQGFPSGDALLSALENTPPMEQAIQLETDRRMLEENGSILLDGTLDERAQVAAANDVREAVLRAEIRALNAKRRQVAPFVKAQQAISGEQLEAERKERDYERRWLEAEARLRIAIAEGYKQTEIDALQKEVATLRRQARGGAVTIAAGVPNAATIRQAAEARVARTRIRDLKPGLFWSAAREASTKATAAAARQDFDEAIKWKTAELVNLANYREAGSALEDVQRRVKAAKDLSKASVRATLGLAGEAYTDQVDGILDRYEFAKVPAKVLQRRAGVRDFVEGLESQGLPVDLPDEVLNDARRINYSEVTVEELIGITDGLQQIVHLARFKTRLLRNAEKRTLDKLAADLARSIETHSKGARREGERDRRPQEERRRSIAAFFASHEKLATTLYTMDGFADGGPMWDAIMRPLNEAGARESEMTASASSSLQQLLDAAFPGKERSRLYEKTHVDAVGKSLSRMERLMVAMNWGNEGNRQRVRDGEKWNDRQVAAVLATLDARDWSFVQGTLDYLDSFWDEIAAKQTRVYGIAPAKVEAVPIRTAFGEFRGGYFPLKYDERLSARAMGHLDLEAGNLAKQAAYAQATTKRNHTKARAQRNNLPLRRDFGVIFEHVGQVIHDLSHHEALIDVGRVLAHGDVSSAILEHYGDETYRQMKATIRDVAFGEVPATQAFEKMLNYVRAGATIAGMGWSLSTALLQPIGITQSIVRLGGPLTGTKWVAKGVGRWIRDAVTMESSVDWINSRSAFMRSRARTQQREINEIRNTIGASAGKLGGWVDEVLSKTTFDLVSKQGIADSYFYLILKMQQVVDVPTWLGAYEKAMADGNAEERAIAIADQIVLDSQGGGQAKDLAQVQRGTPALKLWMNFYSFFNTTYNLAVASKRQTKHPAEIGRLAVDYLLLFTIPATLGFVMRRAIFGGGDDDEDTGEALVRENLAYTLGLMAGVRELSGFASGYNGYEGPAGARGFSALGRFVKQAEQGEADEAFWRSLWDAGGVFLHYPTSQTRRTFQGISALVEGRTSNPLVVFTGAPEE